MKVEEIAALVNGNVIGDASLEITGTAKIEQAQKNDLSFISNQKYEKFLTTSQCGAVIISKTINISELSPLPPAVIQVDEPYVSFIIAMEKLQPVSEKFVPGIHTTAIIPASAKIGENCSIGAYVVLGENVTIANNVVIQHNCVIENNCEIGSDSIIYSNVTIRDKSIIGERVILHPGIVIGADGFGFLPQKDGTYKKIPQLGRVIIEDDVEIGANSCIDRATLGETIIKRGTKIDNLVQIAHNVVIGEHTGIAAQTGIAGSTKIGNFVKIAGQVGITGHLVIGNNVTIGAQSLASHDLRKEGETYWGYPAKESARMKRIEASLRNLPEALKLIYELEKVVATLKTKMTAPKKIRREHQPQSNSSTYSSGYPNYNR
ncbi:MAG: UDP-3-O-(3-hydroxymyristoyl)glucosamine N-acyltransferase [Ignavibacteria bacterium]|nr:UDP-3-O-(3-hydroxymyristoyl)glucosamine N-acyltransferase [Bacteroidota bacterium]MSQ46438.1 UDP-3-O-(3-hydroxymyristoyl)glucosamine N-acyltransferase [Ignavibacteria bacterium]